MSCSPFIDRAGYFEPALLSEDDVERAKFYETNLERQTLQTDIADYGEFLASLDMTAEIGPFSSKYLDRITQLINKTNQFNLTTRRYNLSEVEAMSGDGSALTLYGKLKDKFGDNGMISVVICRSNSDNWEIDTWLMSCRVLKRRVEEQILQFLLEKARDVGVKHLKGIYQPTAKNKLVRYHYRDLGFEKGDETAAGEQIWWLDVNEALEKGSSLPFALV